MGLGEEVKELKENVNSLLEALNDKNKAQEKKFKFPFGKKVGRSQKKKNYVTILLLNENSIYEFKKYQILDQTIIHDLIPRLATAGHVMFDKKGNPMIILPSWSVEPFSALDHYEKSMINGSNTKGFKVLMSVMENSKAEMKKKVGKIVPWIIGGILAIIIIYALISGGGA